LNVRIKVIKDKGFLPVISARDNEKWCKFLVMTPQLHLCLIGYGEYQNQYDRILLQNNMLQLSGALQAEEGTRCVFKDSWYIIDKNTIQLDRQIKVVERGKSQGLRILTSFETCFEKGVNFHDFWYLAPPAFYKHNDLDHDGMPDWLGTKNLMFSEDRLTSPVIMGYHLSSNFYIALIRADLPRYDDLRREPHMRFFISNTDIGSLGWMENKVIRPPQMVFRASYPFYEGEKSFALTKQGEDWGAFLPIRKMRSTNVSYQVRLKKVASFFDAMWDLLHYLFDLYKPTPISIPFSLSDSIDYRVQLLDQFYKEWKEADGKNPAGFFINFIPTEGKVLSHIIEYGFTGKTILNAWGLMKEGYNKKNANFINKARKVVDFFVKECQTNNGLFFNLYDVERKSPAFWWVGLFMPLNYIKPNELEYYVGPIMKDEYLSIVVNELSKKKGCYMRSMSEEAYALLLCYETESLHGVSHESWLKAAINYGNFLLRSQNTDGSWNKAYDLEGKEITQPKIWAGTDHERKADTAAAIPFLIKLYELTKEHRYLDAALKA